MMKRLFHLALIACVLTAFCPSARAADCTDAEALALTSFKTLNFRLGGPETITAACRAQGAQAYVFVADESWTAGEINSQGVADLLTAFETGLSGKQSIYNGMMEIVGAPTDLYPGKKTYILVHRIDNYEPDLVTAYMNAADLSPQGGGNGRKMLYIDSRQTTSDKRLGNLAYWHCAMTAYDYDLFGNLRGVNAHLPAVSEFIE